MKWFVASFLMLIAVSCSRANKTSETNISGGDPFDKFEISKENQEKFKVEKVTEVVPVVTPLPAIEVKEHQNEKLKTTTTSKSKSLKTKTLVAIAPTVIPIEKRVPNYPSDYPENFKKYDVESAKFWYSFKPKLFVGEKFYINIKYLGVTAGQIVMETREKVSIGGRKAFHLTSQLKSAEYYKYIYELEDRLDTYISEEEFLPLKYSLIQRESGQNVDDLQLFDREKIKTSYWYKRVKKGTEKNEHAEVYIPYYSQDSFSALYFTRGFPLKKGDIYEFPVITRGKFWVLKAWVEGEDQIEVAGQKVNALRIRAETNFPGVLKKSGDILFWFSNDDQRRILRFTAKVKIGTIEGELAKYEAAAK